MQSYALIGELGFKLGSAIKWWQTFARIERLHPESRQQETHEGRTYTLYLHDLTDERDRTTLGPELQLAVVPKRLDLWLGAIGMWTSDADNTVAPSDYDMTGQPPSSSGHNTTSTASGTCSPRARFRQRTQCPRERYRATPRSIEANTGGQSDLRGLSMGTSPRARPSKSKPGYCSHPKAQACSPAPSSGFFTAQISNQNNALGNQFEQRESNENTFAPVERHLHHLVALGRDMVLIRTLPSLRSPARPRPLTQLRRRSAPASPSSSMDPSPKTAINGTPWRISSAPSLAGAVLVRSGPLRDLRRRTLTDRARALADREKLDALGDLVEVNLGTQPERRALSAGRWTRVSIVDRQAQRTVAQRELEPGCAPDAATKTRSTPSTPSSTSSLSASRFVAQHELGAAGIQRKPGRNPASSTSPWSTGSPTRTRATIKRSTARTHRVGMGVTSPGSPRTSIIWSRSA